MEEKQEVQSGNKIIYLHIGQPKTGTSSVQKFCYANAEVLARNGICFELMPFTYYKTRKERNGRFLSAAVRDENRVLVKDGKEQRTQEAFGIIAEQLKRFDKVLLTDEALWNYLPRTHYKMLIRLCEFAKEQGARVCVLAYLRPQDDWIESLYRQRLQDSDTYLPWDTFFAQGMPAMAVDYEAVCNGIAEIIGKENLLLRLYDRKLFPEGKIETDFLDAIGVTDLTGLIDPQQEANPSLTKNYAEVLRHLNALNDDENLKLTNKLYEKAALACSVRYQETEKTTLFSKEQRAALLERFAAGNERISQTYLQKGELKIKEEVALPVWNPDNPELFTDAIRLINEILDREARNDLPEEEKEQEIQVDPALRQEQIEQFLFSFIQKKQKQTERLQEKVEQLSKRVKEFEDLERERERKRDVVGRAYRKVRRMIKPEKK